MKGIPACQRFGKPVYGAKTGFGPFHVGDPVEKLAILGIEKSQDANGEVTTGTEEFRFRFTYGDGKITTMSYCYRDRGFMDAS